MVGSFFYCYALGRSCRIDMTFMQINGALRFTGKGLPEERKKYIIRWQMNNVNRAN